MDSPNPRNAAIRTPAAPRKINVVSRLVDTSTIESHDFVKKLRFQPIRITRAATRKLTFDSDKEPLAKKCCYDQKSPWRKIQQEKMEAMENSTTHDSALGSSLEEEKFVTSTPKSASYKGARKRHRYISPLDDESKAVFRRKLVDEYEFLESDSDETTKTVCSDGKDEGDSSD